MIGMRVARWIGIAIDCASVSRRIVNRLDEASSPSFAIGEKEERSSVCCISLAMPSSLLRTTSTVIGSSSILLPLAREDEIAGSVHDAGPAGLDQGRGVG